MSMSLTASRTEVYRRFLLQPEMILQSYAVVGLLAHRRPLYVLAFSSQRPSSPLLLAWADASCLLAASCVPPSPAVGAWCFV